jgi:hypothetical protein
MLAGRSTERTVREVSDRKSAKEGRTEFTLRDLLYLDFDKAASIWSQFEEGLLKSIDVTEDTGKDRAAGTKFGLKFGVPGLADAQAEANLGVDYIQKRSTLQSKILHHDVLIRVETRLEQSGLVSDLSSLPPQESSAEQIRASFADRPYLRAEGLSVIEDYRRILAISSRFNDIVKHIVKSGEAAIKQSSEYQLLQQQIAEAKDSASQAKDKNVKAAQRAKIKAFEQTVEQLSTPQVQPVEPWIIDAMKDWIDTFMPNRINFRIYPFPECPSFQVLCNLKRECFIDSDLEHLLYGYGTRPNVKLAVFGLITSLPTVEAQTFDPLSEFSTRTDLSDAEVFEKAFRGVFYGMDDLESFARYSRYPNVTVHPIAVYRSFSVRDR